MFLDCTEDWYDMRLGPFRSVQPQFKTLRSYPLAQPSRCYIGLRSAAVLSTNFASKAQLQEYRSSAPSTLLKMASSLTSQPLASIDLSEYDPEQSRLMDERCIVVTPDDVAIGALDKKTCHLMANINKGLLHRAFSAFVFRPEDGKLLLQQRATEKITFPDMWTNTCCSHPLDDFEQEKVEKDQLGKPLISI